MLTLMAYQESRAASERGSGVAGCSCRPVRAGAGQWRTAPYEHQAAAVALASLSYPAYQAWGQCGAQRAACTACMWVGRGVCTAGGQALASPCTYACICMHACGSMREPTRWCLCSIPWRVLSSTRLVSRGSPGLLIVGRLERARSKIVATSRPTLEQGGGWNAHLSNGPSAQSCGNFSRGMC